jgi:hypothetical protein
MVWAMEMRLRIGRSREVFRSISARSDLELERVDSTLSRFSALMLSGAAPPSSFRLLFPTVGEDEIIRSTLRYRADLMAYPLLARAAQCPVAGPDSVGAVSQRLTPTGERSGLQMHIAVAEAICTPVASNAPICPACGGLHPTGYRWRPLFVVLATFIGAVLLVAFILGH